MSGSIESYQTKTGRQWMVRYRDETGRQRKKKQFPRKRDAELYLADVQVKQARGEWVDPGLGKQTLGWYAEKWLGQQVHLKETTRHLNEQWYRNHIAPRWADRQLGSIRPTEVRAWVAELNTPRPKLDEGGKPVLDKRGEPVMESVGVPTIHRTFAVLRRILNAAVQDRLITTSPADHVRLPRHQAADRAVLTHEQVDLLADEVADPLESLVVLFLAYTGLRYGELAALRVSDLDVLRRRLTVRRSVTEVKGEFVWSAPKSGRERVVAFPSFLVRPLAAQLVGRDRDALVFSVDGSTVLRNTNFRPRVFNPAVKRCRAADPSFPKVTIHDLRHTAATLAIQAGASVKTLQQMLGHASASMTLDIYAAYLPDALDSVADVLEQQRARARAGAESAVP